MERRRWRMRKEKETIISYVKNLKLIFTGLLCRNNFLEYCGTNI
jgi:hypothetical protein